MPAYMAFLAFLALLLYLLVRLLNCHSTPDKPSLFHGESTLVAKILEQCPILYQCYDPPSLWGRSGHLQTAMYSLLGRVNSPFPRGERRSVLMHDGATLSFDVFQPLASHKNEGDYTLIVVPGLGNSSESVYIRTLINYMQNLGYRVAVLNHQGALKTEKITAPRLFTYGGTEDLALMVQTVLTLFPSTTLIGVGFSMGGNILCKYLGEDSKHCRRFLCAVSACQGYDAVRALGLLMRWDNFRRAYIWLMTENMKRIVRRHQDVLCTIDCNHGDKPSSSRVDLQQTLASTSLIGFDEYFTRRAAGYDSLIDYYRDHSSARVINNIKIPMMLVNAKDDPIVPSELLSCAYEYVEISVLR
ncbi:PREDICTED: abhydrolase domain-containing protein 2-like isoform X2 [Priapulus caudatus]|uniref:Abhydrolase domain-containing protein 2-like isoform X2 n=1 Tax=Priapulus caudatus TaxID=37621 RepID=A0ABM1ECM5_PRICU|nr:PREDICTED: abhydrolase domain-containing protein 2-like isoform X2 [Priapulus caudatus]